VAVGRAIVRKPKVFLFDEPLSNLDAKLRVQMRAEISRLHQQLGATMLYVTHDQVEAMTMGTRITLMKDGLIQQIDAPLTLYREPANRFVAEFIGSPSMNLFDGSFRPKGSAYRFEHPVFSLDIAEVEHGDGFPDRVALGIRPENLRLAEAGPLAIPARVELVEPLGSEIYLHASVGEVRMVARLGPEATAQPGDTVNLAPDPARLHFFDGASGVALRPSVANVGA
jgi:multiple sugar transport system ATP-binding protein